MVTKGGSRMPLVHHIEIVGPQPDPARRAAHRQVARLHFLTFVRGICFGRSSILPGRATPAAGLWPLGEPSAAAEPGRATVLDRWKFHRGVVGDGQSGAQPQPPDEKKDSESENFTTGGTHDSPLKTI